jgi:hypothetical protein
MIKSIFLFPGLLIISIFYSEVFSQEQSRVIHVFVALCDNENQGIVPVPKKLGNGLDTENNLYWGALYGVRSFFTRSSDWELVVTTHYPSAEILERCVFKYLQGGDIYLVADAYRGDKIRESITDFLDYASGNNSELISLSKDSAVVSLKTNTALTLAAYVGHDGLMDFDLENYPQNREGNGREAIVLACASKQFFGDALREAGAKSILLTTGLMAPEAYTLKAAIDGWILNETPEQIRLRAAEAYNQYQKCGLKAARNLFSGN